MPTTSLVRRTDAERETLNRLIQNPTRRLVADLRGQVVTEGFDLARRGTPNRRVRGTVRAGEPEATMIAWRLAAAAAGFAHWTLRPLAERAVTREIVESVRHETVRRTLKKTA